MLVIKGQMLQTPRGVRVCGRWWGTVASGGLLATMLEVSEGQGLGTPDT